jgi:hypothetical protein
VGVDVLAMVILLPGFGCHGWALACTPYAVGSLGFDDDRSAPAFRVPTRTTPDGLQILTTQHKPQSLSDDGGDVEVAVMMASIFFAGIELKPKSKQWRENKLPWLKSNG